MAEGFDNEDDLLGLEAETETAAHCRRLREVRVRLPSQ